MKAGMRDYNSEEERLVRWVYYEIQVSVRQIHGEEPRRISTHLGCLPPAACCSRTHLDTEDDGALLSPTQPALPHPQHFTQYSQKPPTPSPRSDSKIQQGSTVKGVMDGGKSSQNLLVGSHHTCCWTGSSM